MPTDLEGHSDSDEAMLCRRLGPTSLPGEQSSVVERWHGDDQKTCLYIQQKAE